MQRNEKQKDSCSAGHLPKAAFRHDPLVWTEGRLHTARLHCLHCFQLPHKQKNPSWSQSWGQQISTKCLLQVSKHRILFVCHTFLCKDAFCTQLPPGTFGLKCAFALNIGGVVLSKLSRVSTWKHIWRPDIKHGDHLKTSQKSKWVCKSLYMSYVFICH